MTVIEMIREHLEWVCGMPEERSLTELLRHECRPLIPLLALCVNRLVMGKLRYGPMRTSAPDDRAVQYAAQLLERYQTERNAECLIDAINLLAIQWLHGRHTMRAADDGKHIAGPGRVGK